MRESFRFTLAAFIANILLAIILMYFFGIIGAAIAFVSGTAVQGILAFIFMRKTFGIQTSGLLKRSLFDAINFVREKLARSK